MNNDVLVKCEHVSKKFCRGLKRSLWYGIQDISADLNLLKKKNIISVDGPSPELRKDEFWAVKDISFELKRGECLGLIGHNGAGKSTLLKMLNGLIKPDHGQITMRGRIGAMIELNAGFNPILTGRENVYIYGTILGFTKKEIDQKYETIVEFAEMDEFMEMPFRSYSSGMKVRLGFAVATQMEPDVLIIDEVLAVGDMGFRMKCYNKIGELLEKAAVIFVSHSMPYIARICNEVILLQQGNLELKTSNIPDGIKHYYQKFEIVPQKITGSEKAEVTSFRFVETNCSSITIIPKKELTFEFFLDIKDPNYEHCFFKVEIWNQDLRPSLEIIPEENSFYIKKSKVTVSIPELFLTAGNYTLTIAILSYKGRQVLNRIANIGRITMMNKLAYNADLYSMAKVSITKETGY